MSQSCYVKTNGITLHYLDHTGNGPTMILTHGLSANAHFFDGLIKAGLAPALHVLAVDLRGRGLSDKPDHGYSMADHAADIIGLMDALGLERVVMAGHSFGGLLTYYLAAHYPGRIAKCVVIDAPAETDQQVLEQIQPSLDRLRKVLPSWQAYLERVKAMPYYKDWWEPEIEDFYRADLMENPDGTVQSRLRPQNIEEAVQGTIDIKWQALAPHIEQSLLLLRAPGSFGPPGYPPLLPLDKAEKTIALIRNGQLVELRGNHITWAFGANAPLAIAAITAFVLES